MHMYSRSSPVQALQWDRTGPLGFLLIVLSFEHVLGSALNLLQWNPHWQCFNLPQYGECRSQVPRLLEQRLTSLDVDFANIVELNISWDPPAHWRTIRTMCSPSNLHCFDQVTLIYNSAKWVPSEESEGSAKGCIQSVPHPNRPYIIQHFRARQGTEQVIVVGAHYSHCNSIGSLQSATDRIMNSTGVRRLVLLADTNRYAPNFNQDSSNLCEQAVADFTPACAETCPGAAICNTSKELLVQLTGQYFDGKVLSTELQPSCCSNNWVGFKFPFDRIIANFGLSMKTTLLDDPDPVWVSREFHKAVFGVLSVDWNGTSPRFERKSALTPLGSDTDVYPAPAPTILTWSAGLPVLLVFVGVGVVGFVGVMQLRRRGGRFTSLAAALRGSVIEAKSMQVAGTDSDD